LSVCVIIPDRTSNATGKITGSARKNSQARPALVAYSLKVYGLFEHRELLADTIGDLDLIERFVVKINDPFASDAPKMLVLSR
jgi:hypothetical protein